jgi:hypothetical protein
LEPVKKREEEYNRLLDEKDLALSKKDTLIESLNTAISDLKITFDQRLADLKLQMEQTSIENNQMIDLKL